MAIGLPVSSYHQIFVRTTQSASELAADVGVAAGVQLTEEPENPIRYAGKKPYAAIEIELSHDFADDYGIPFEKYPIVITIRDFDRDMVRQEAVAREVFSKLAASGKYSLILVYNLDTLLDRSDVRE